MIKLIQYFKTAKGRTNLKWGLVVLVLVVVAICLFKRVNSPDSDSPLVKRLEAVNDSLRIQNSRLEVIRQEERKKSDSLLSINREIETRIIQTTKYVEIQVAAVDTFTDNQLLRFLAERYK